MNGPTKVCTGPAHPGPAMLPLSDFGVYRSGPRAGKPLARCRLCRHWSVLKVKEGPHGLVAAASLKPFAAELINRCGSVYRASQQHGLSEPTLLGLAAGAREKVRAATAQRLLVGLSEQRKYDRRNGSSIRFHEARLAQARIDERMERDGCG